MILYANKQRDSGSFFSDNKFSIMIFISASVGNLPISRGVIQDPRFEISVFWNPIAELATAAIEILKM